MYMHSRMRNIVVTGLLLLVLAGVLIVEVSVFIAGPNQKYEQDIAAVKTKIAKDYKNIDAVERHAFHYVTYSGRGSQYDYWFDQDGKLLMKRSIKEDRREEALQKAIDKHQIEEANVTLGYGYKNAVYIVTGKQKTVYYDFDSLKQVYYREGTV